jgi:hypothetical protein
MATTSLPASKLVNVNISLQAASVSQLAFGVPLIWDLQNVRGSGTLGNVSFYNSLSEMSADGYATYDAAYKMAQLLVAQQPRVNLFAVGCIDQTGQTVAECLDKLATQGTSDWYALLLADPTRDDQTIQDAAAWAEAQQNTKFLFAAQFGSQAIATGSALYADQRVQTSCFVTGQQAQVQEMTISDAFVSDAAVTLKINGTSYGPVPYNTSSNQTLTDLATEIATCPAVASAVAHTSTKSITVTANSPLVDLVFSNYAGGGATPTTAKFAVTTESDAPVDAAACGRILPLGAGQATLGEKTLNGVQPLALTTSQATTLEGIRMNYYTRIGGRAITYPGTCSADIATGVPLFADLVFGAAAFKADLLAAFLDFLTASKKVPYNDSGIAGAVSVLAKVAKNYVGKGYLEPFDQKTAITFPLAADVPPADKSLRILNGISANFTATGAIQQLGEVNITINA